MAQQRHFYHDHPEYQCLDPHQHQHQHQQWDPHEPQHQHQQWDQKTALANSSSSTTNSDTAPMSLTHKATTTRSLTERLSGRSSDKAAGHVQAGSSSRA
ncbi:hypothetical protein ACQY0O_003612 [Thecaphora frezii]